LNLVERIHDDTLRGEFTITTLLFHQADLPSYILLAELGIDQTLRGELPVWDYPPALRESATAVWWDHAGHTLRYARSHARSGRVAKCDGLLSEAACHTGHAIVAHRGEWITNKKQLLTSADLPDVDHIIAHPGTDPAELLQAVSDTDELLTSATQKEGI
jgi:hypothetical protein